MGAIRRMRNPIRDYPWGSHTALAELMGRPAPSTGPEAELWMGAHESAPSQVETPEGWLGLDAWIRAAPSDVLGPSVAREYDARLPYLFKVLAPEHALSIQAHPSPAQAREGFARENAAGLALDAPNRCYRDASHKPELVCALGRFEALCGFRSRDAIAAGLRGLAVAELAPELAALESGSDAQGLAGLLETLLGRAPEARRQLVERVAAAVGRAAEADAALAWVQELARQHPADPGVLAPLILHLVTLEPGEALFLPAGELHAYLRGTAVELMANSDNVLRGGLTQKHVDVPELLRTLRFAESPPAILRPRPREPGVAAYETPAREFVLSRLEVRSDQPLRVAAPHALEILLCVRGRAQVRGGGDASAIERGESAAVAAAIGSYEIAGDAQLYRAGVPM